MEKQNLKKLSKKKLRVIAGGLMKCIDPFTGQCKTISKSCGERECRIILDPPLD